MTCRLKADDRVSPCLHETALKFLGGTFVGMGSNMTT